jgi:hypothetical protein
MEDIFVWNVSLNGDPHSRQYTLWQGWAKCGVLYKYQGAGIGMEGLVITKEDLNCKHCA